MARGLMDRHYDRTVMIALWELTYDEFTFNGLHDES